MIAISAAFTQRMSPDFVYFVGKLAGSGGEQKERKDEYPCAQRYQLYPN